MLCALTLFVCCTLDVFGMRDAVWCNCLLSILLYILVEDRAAAVAAAVRYCIGESGRGASDSVGWMVGLGNDAHSLWDFRKIVA